MHFALTALAAAGLSMAGTIPVQQRDVQQIPLTFHGAGTSYTITVPSDDTYVETKNSLVVTSITSPGVDLFHDCTFFVNGPTSGSGTTVGVYTSDNGATTDVVTVGPPQIIDGAKCK